MSHLRTKALRNRVNELLSEYEISEIIQALYSNVDNHFQDLASYKETFIIQEKNEEMLKAKSDSQKLFACYNSFC